MSVKRYQPAPFTERVLHASEDGEYVKYEDYVALEARCAALAAENAGLKAAIETHKHGFVRCNCCGDELMCHTDDVCRALDETPATDSFLAEVRAQGLNAFIQHHSAELDAHIKNGGEQFDEKSVRIRDIIVSARLFREQIRKGVQS